MNLDYDHKLNPHRAIDSSVVIPVIFSEGIPSSLLDVGCGTGTWTKAAQAHGVKDVLGIDGNALGPGSLIPPEQFQVVDLTTAWNIGRRFEMAFCLEVAEHLDEACAAQFVEALTRHSDTIVFSAACPGQAGQHHVNCQWPEYWQQLFNMCGYVCVDSIRPKIWSDQRIAPWYRQNIFVASKDGEHAGKERRLPSFLHPEIFGLAQHCASILEYEKLIASGILPWTWYASVPFGALWSKLKRRILRRA